MARPVAREGAREKLLLLARERGFVTLDDVMRVAVDEPVDLEELRESLDEAGYELVEDEEDAPKPLAWAASTAPSSAADRAEEEESVIGAHILRAAALEAEELMPDTPAAIYLRDISRVPLLTAEEEVMLAKQLEAGDIARGQLDGEQAPGADIESLEDVAHIGAEARRRLTESNLRLVVSVARKYMGRGLPLLDLIQEGNIGLSRAVEKYDYRKGYRFSTYAYWWIRQAVTRAIANQSRTIRVPVHMIDQIGHVYSKYQELQQKLGHDPKVEELAAAMDMTVEKVREAFRASANPISLETPVGSDEENTLGDLLSNQQEEAPADVAERTLLSDYLDDALEELTPRERMVLRMRFGISDQRPRTLGEIGQVIGVSRERVRQLEAEAIAKLRRPNLRLKLAEYLE